MGENNPIAEEMLPLGHFGAEVVFGIDLVHSFEIERISLCRDNGMSFGDCSPQVCVAAKREEDGLGAVAWESGGRRR